MTMPKMIVTMALLALSLRAFAVDMPLYVGGHAHGVKNIQALADLGVGNMIWIPKPNLIQDGNTPWDKTNDVFADINCCLRNNMSFFVSQGRGLGLPIRMGGGEYGGDGCGTMWDAATVRKMRKVGGDRFLGLQCEEIDADLVQSGLRPSFRSRYPEMFDYTDRAGGRACFERELTKLKDLYHGYGPGVKYWPNLCMTMQHSGFRIGADLVIAELLEHLPTTELQLAYLRGGARQFGGQWGIWVSPWLAGTIPTEDKTLWPAPYATVGGGHSPSFLRRCLYESYVSGSRVFATQNTDCLFSYKDPANHDAGYKLAAWGTELRNFYDYAKNHTESMRPIVPIAVLVDKNNGWCPGRLWGNWVDHDTVWGKLPTDRTDKMLSSYLDVLLPGFARTGDCWEKKIYYPGYFAPTPVGPFDIVSSDIAPPKLAEYCAVLVLGDVDMSPELLATLKTYVAGGGTLYINVDQMRSHEAWVQDKEFLGTGIGGHTWKTGDGKPVIGSHVTGSTKIVRKLSLRGVDEKESAEPWFCSVDVQPCGAEVVADDGAGNPVLLRNHFGRGWVYLSVPEYMMEGLGEYSARLNFFASMVRGLAGMGPVSVTARGSDAPQADISWLASYQGKDSVVVLLVNHGDTERPIDVTWRGACRDGRVEVGNATLSTLARKSSTTFSLTVCAQDVVVLRFAN